MFIVLEMKQEWSLWVFCRQKNINKEIVRPSSGFFDKALFIMLANTGNFSLWLNWIDLSFFKFAGNIN